MNLIHFIGSHRTGSKKLSEFFNEHKECVSKHIRFSQIIMNFISNIYFAGKINKNIHDFFASKMIYSWVKNQNTLNVVETNGWNLGSLNLLANKYEETKIIHIVRDPREAVTSLINFRRRNKIKHFLYRNLPFWELKDLYPKIMLSTIWKNFSEAEQVAWQWRIKNDYISETFGSSKNYLMIKFDDLFSKDTSQLKRLLKFININFNENNINNFVNIKVNQSPNAGFPSWEKWDSKLCKAIHNICHESMSKFGFEFGHNWNSKLLDGKK